jgi:hypothetical protein
MYILLGLPFGAGHSLLAVAGIIVLLVSHFRSKNGNIVAGLFNILGVLLLFGSIYYFFWADKRHYNYASFQDMVPMLSMILTALMAICFLVGLFGKRVTKNIMAF